jgi:selenocysteine-specific elongation factor
VERHVVIGTAGHVDHGKTALVKALTGVDTDRWEEEKRRGITIDLGFAPLDLGDGLAASVVDVPGHEDFVRNMVAGATGVDVALLVVAADEGVMPQTVEHTAILRFLDVPTGVVALTKADLVEPEWLDLVAADIAQHLAGDRMSWEPPVVVSAATGQGLEQLREALRRAAARARPRSSEDLFRLPVDRVFSLPGAGTVVTGTVWSGSIAAGEEALVFPGSLRARVRSVEVHGRPVPRALPGRRTALALVGVDRTAARRGSEVVSDPAWQPTATLDVLISLLPEARPLTQRSRLRLHLGTAEVMARVVPAGDRVEPGAQQVPARLKLETEVLARWGDRGVLRNPSPPATVGGFVVVDPLPALRPRRPVQLAERAAREPAARLAAFVAAAGPRGIARRELTVRLGLKPLEVDAVVRQAAGQGIAEVAGRLLPERAAAGARDQVLDRLAAFHREQPMLPGMPLEAFRKLVGDPELASQVLETLETEGLVAREGGFVRLAGHQARIPAALSSLASSTWKALEGAGFEGLSAAELLARHPGSPVVEVAEFGVRQGTVVRIGTDRYYDRSELERAARLVLAALRDRGQLAPSEVRDVLKLTRKHLIPILEWMDSRGYTIRAGDVRRPGPAAHLLE